MPLSRLTKPLPQSCGGGCQDVRARRANNPVLKFYTFIWFHHLIHVDHLNRFRSRSGEAMSWSKMSVFIPQSHKYSTHWCYPVVDIIQLLVQHITDKFRFNKTARFDLLLWNWCNSTLHQKVTLCVCVGTNLLSFGRRIWKNKRYQNTIWCMALFYLLAKTKATKAEQLIL